MGARTSIVRCQNALATIWMTGAGLFVLLLVIQSEMGKYSEPKRAWQWFLPTVVPSFTLVMSGRAYTALYGSKRDTADRSWFWLTVWLSVFYLLLVAFVILAEPVSPYPASQLMEMSHLWLAPAQGFVTAALGGFFVSHRDGSPGGD